MARRKQQAATEAVRQPKLNITLRTVKNGYLLDVEGEGYMYFNEQSLVEGFCRKACEAESDPRSA